MGELLFKLLVQKAVIFMEGTASKFRENLKKLETYTTMVNYNIGTFNQDLKVNMEG